MPIKISREAQFHHEHKTWYRLLEFYRQENNILKTRLAEVLDESSGKEFLPQAEYFQHKFISSDERMGELIRDVNLQYTTPGVLKESNADNTITRLQQKLRIEISCFEKDFNELKNGFNNCLSSL